MLRLEWLRVTLGITLVIDSDECGATCPVSGAYLTSFVSLRAATGALGGVEGNPRSAATEAVRLRTSTVRTPSFSAKALLARNRARAPRRR